MDPFHIRCTAANMVKAMERREITFDEELQGEEDEIDDDVDV